MTTTTGTQAARERLWSIRHSDDLEAWADAVDHRTDWEQPTWCILSDLLAADPPRDEGGMDTEYVVAACRLAVRNIDPEYHGYTPWGNV